MTDTATATARLEAAERIRAAEDAVYGAARVRAAANRLGLTMSDAAVEAYAARMFPNPEPTSEAVIIEAVCAAFDETFGPHPTA